MPPSKRIGFFWDDDKITLAEFEKNSPIQIVSSPLGLKSSTLSPFSSNLTEEIQVTTILKKLLQDHRISCGSFYVSLPMKEIILRSFSIPFVKTDDLANAVKFEAKRYIPFDIKDLSFVFHTIPVTEGPKKSFQVIFFAVRKEVLARYERVLQQVNAVIDHSEPYTVSLAKALLFRKEIKPTAHLAFLILDKHLGRICFISKGVPQFIREFPVNSASPGEESNEPPEALNLKIVNEVGNSFDFYSRQFSGEKVEEVLVCSEFVQKDLLDALEAELKLKISKFSPVISTGSFGQSNDMDAIYAMGVCVTPPLELFSKLNFAAEKSAKVENETIKAIKPFKETLLALGMAVVFLVGVHFFFQMQLKVVQNQFDRLSASEGEFATETQDSLQSDIQSNTDKLNQYKKLKVRTNMATIILKIASHVPKGALLNSFQIAYNSDDLTSSNVTIDVQGMVVSGDASQQIATVNQICSDFKNDKELAQFINSVNLVSLTHTTYNDKEATGFTIHFS